MSHDESPTARALLLLELLQNNPGITADRLAGRLGVSERAARRYVGILREAGIPVESTRGPYGGYRLGRGLRLPPLMFTATEALGLVMAVLEGHHDAADPSGPAGSALGKLLRALPEPVAHPAEAVRKVSARASPARPRVPTPTPPPPSSRPPPHTARCASATGWGRPASAPWRSTPGRSSCTTAAGICCAGHTPATRDASCAWTG